VVVRYDSALLPTFSDDKARIAKVSIRTGSAQAIG
jgi:hypothetical protein